MPTSSSQQMFYQFSNSFVKESSSIPILQQRPKSIGPHSTALGHMTIPERIAGDEEKECADWPNLEQEVGPFSLNIKDESIPWEKSGCYCQKKAGWVLKVHTSLLCLPLRSGSSSLAMAQGPPAKSHHVCSVRFRGRGQKTTH